MGVGEPLCPHFKALQPLEEAIGVVGALQGTGGERERALGQATHVRHGERLVVRATHDALLGKVPVGTQCRASERSWSSFTLAASASCSAGASSSSSSSR